MNLIRFNSRVIDAGKVTGVERTDAGVAVFIGGFESWKFAGDEAAAVWAFFVNLAPDGMKAPAMADPTTSAATDARDRQWQGAFTAWVRANESRGAYYQGPPLNPGEVGAAMEWLAHNLAQHAERDAAAAQKAAG